MLLLACSLNAQIKETSSSSSDTAKEKKQDFANQGEEENYWAVQFFNTEYKNQTFENLEDSSIFISEDTIKYGNKILEIKGINPEFKPIFKKQISYLDVIPYPDTISICCVQELNFLDISPKIKRFSCWLFRMGFANPTVYFIELTNDNANDKTDLENFMVGAKITFFKSGWVVI